MSITLTWFNRESATLQVGVSKVPHRRTILHKWWIFTSGDFCSLSFSLSLSLSLSLSSSVSTTVHFSAPTESWLSQGDTQPNVNQLQLTPYQDIELELSATALLCLLCSTYIYILFSLFGSLATISLCSPSLILCISMVVFHSLPLYHDSLSFAFFALHLLSLSNSVYIFFSLPAHPWQKDPSLVDMSQGRAGIRLVWRKRSLIKHTI